MDSLPTEIIEKIFYFARMGTPSYGFINEFKLRVSDTNDDTLTDEELWSDDFIEEYGTFSQNLLGFIKMSKI